MAQDFIVANPGRSLRGAGDQSGLKLPFFTDDDQWHELTWKITDANPVGGWGELPFQRNFPTRRICNQGGAGGKIESSLNAPRPVTLIGRRNQTCGSPISEGAQSVDRLKPWSGPLLCLLALIFSTSATANVGLGVLLVFLYFANHRLWAAAEQVHSTNAVLFLVDR
jgi:hypothetical protein